ncbi:MAG: antitoxin VapB family protein [archaeon GB-1867-005]|nr:antitoxin VapB family protein [Candidatus Culexmicrobium cathedralense]
MGKVIMVSDEVYERLKSMKKPGKPFSDVVKHLLEYKLRLFAYLSTKLQLI